MRHTAESGALYHRSHTRIQILSPNCLRPNEGLPSDLYHITNKPKQTVFITTRIVATLLVLV